MARIERSGRNFYSRTEELVPLDRGARFLAVATTRLFQLEEGLVPRRTLDAVTGEERSLGDVGLIRMPESGERFRRMLAGMPPGVAAIAEHSLLNPAVSGDRRAITMYPTIVAGAAHGKRCALVLGTLGGWAYRLRIVDTDTMAIVTETDLGRLHPFLDKGVISLALDGQGSKLAIARLLLERTETGDVGGRIVTSFLPDLAAPAAFTVETPLPLEGESLGLSLYMSTNGFHLGWCEGRWLISRPWEGKWSLLVLDEEGGAVGEKRLSGPACSLAAASTKAVVALGIAPGGVEVVDLATMTSRVYQPFGDGDPQDHVDVAIAPDASWVAARRSSGELVGIVPDRDRTITLPRLDLTFEDYDEDNDLCTSPAFGIGTGGLMTISGGAPTLHEIDLG